MIITAAAAPTRAGPRRAPLAVAALLSIAAPVHADHGPDGAPVKTLGVVTVTGGQPTSLPTQIPATMEGITRAQIEQTINASDAEDALKYFPSLLVRKRYIGDYNHAILSSRASGTGNSARSAVYADGILLSNYLGNGVGGLSFPPRWSMVTPQEIDRVDVMYGPFSAAYPGNSVGAVVVFTTRMPKAFEVHAKVGYTSQPFSLYNTDATYRSWQTSASVGNRSGDFAWLLGFDHTDSHGQPLTFATRLLSSASGSGGTPVTGAVLDANNANSPWYVLGTGTEYRTRQDHFKARLAYDITSTVRANYVLGIWQNTSENDPVSHLRNAVGQSVYIGSINIDGQQFAALNGGDFAATREKLTHVMHGLTVKSHTQGVWDWEANASLYDYRKDDKRQNAAANTLPNALTGGTGTIADGSGTGWNNLALKGTWRPGGMQGEHIVDFGVQQDSYKLQYLTSSIPGNWLEDGAGTRVNDVAGKTRLQGAYVQDAWAFAPRWKTVLGLRAEQWRAYDGLTVIAATMTPLLPYGSRRERFLSPKAALSYQAAADLVLKASAGRAVRMPTVGELYGATSTTNSAFVNDPNLKPERSWTTELTAEKDIGNGLLRLTAFTEDTHDALYSQTTVEPAISGANRNVTRVQNVGRIKTTGLEFAYSGSDVLMKGLDLNGSLTYADSVIKENAGFVVVPGDTIGKHQPNIPKWRATALVSYRFDERGSAAFGARYSGAQYRTLNNADVNGFTYQGVSKYFTTDIRVRYRIDRQWSVAVGIDNLNNYRYWNFHPYPQRSYSAELSFDL
jgi:iron complex outermembrane receptor protein